MEIPSYIFITCVKSFLLYHTTDYWVWSKLLCLSYPFLDGITVRFYSYHFRICEGFMVMYSKKLSQVYTNQGEFCFWKTPQLGFYMLKIIAVLPRCLFPTLGIKVFLTISMCFECGNGHTVSWQDLFNPISDAIITDSF